MTYSLWVGLSITCVAVSVTCICAVALFICGWRGKTAMPALVAGYTAAMLMMAIFIGQPQTILHAGFEHLLLVVLVGCISALVTVHIEGMKAYESGLEAEPPFVKRPMKLLMLMNTLMVAAMFYIYAAL